jgi:hypothetical protein
MVYTSSENVNLLPHRACKKVKSLKRGGTQRSAAEVAESRKKFFATDLVFFHLDMMEFDWGDYA